MGADLVVNHSSKFWIDEILSKIGNKRLDVIFEHIGFSTWKQSLKLLAKGGRLITCGATTGDEVNISLAHLFMKQQSILGSTMSSLDAFYEMMDNVNNKKYKPIVDKIFSFEEIRDAHLYIENRKQMGKVVLVF